MKEKTEVIVRIPLGMRLADVIDRLDYESKLDAEIKNKVHQALITESVNRIKEEIEELDDADVPKNGIYFTVKGYIRENEKGELQKMFTFLCEGKDNNLERTYSLSTKLE